MKHLRTDDEIQPKLESVALIGAKMLPLLAKQR